MNETTLVWDNFNWGRFQTLSIQIAEAYFPDCIFDEYLRTGQKQDGLDLISFNRKDGSILLVQCKREKTLSIGDIDNILHELLTGEYKDKVSIFVISTSADLQKRDLQLALVDRKRNLYDKHRITLEVWDRSSIETRLKTQWSIVSYYFGKQQADDFCFPQLKHSVFDNIKPVADYIPRKLKNLNKTDVREHDIYWYINRKVHDAKDLFLEDRLQTKRVCLIGDSYQGKSSCVKQTAFELKNAGCRIQPLLLEIKGFNVQPVETLLSTLFGAWKNIPFKELLVIIDGLDEVPTDKFDEMIGHIKEFSIAYQSVNILFSCRKLFFGVYEVGKSLSHFDVYELDSLDSENIDHYLNQKLGPLFYKFKDDIYRNSLIGLLYQPFYLVNLAEDYLIPPHKLPGSKLKVLNDFIDRAFVASHGRRLKDGDRVKMNSVQFKQVVERLAFALQLAGLNAFTHEQVQQLFTREEQLLLQHNSLVSVSGDYWSFTNALFQEHLAASLLAELGYEQIVSHCSIGTTIRKVKTKWIQTLSSALSLLEPKSELFQQLFDFIESDNIELIFQTEPSKYTREFKFLVLEKLINRCRSQNTRPMIIYEEAIGLFIDDTPTGVDFVIEQLEDVTASNLIKIICARILKHSSINEKQEARFTNAAVAQIEESTNGYYCGELVEVFTAYKIGDREMVAKLVKMNWLIDQHEYRSSLYELIVTLGLTDDFYSFGLEGIPAFLKYNQRVSHGGSETNLQDFLLASNKRHHLARLLEQSKSSESFTYIDYRGAHRDTFIKRLFHKLGDFYQRDPLIILAVAGFIRNLGRRYLRDELKEVDGFLERTGTHHLVVRLLIENILKENDWELGALITAESYDYVLWEFEAGEYNAEALRNCLSGLRYKRKNEVDDSFLALCQDVLGGELYNTEQSKQYQVYREAESKKRENDIRYIQSLDAFKKGIESFFNDYGKKSIPEEDLYVDSHFATIRHNSDSNFLFAFFIRWLPDQRGPIALKTSLAEISEPGYFEAFRAEEIMNYSYLTDDVQEKLYPLVEEYYQTELPEANFENCQWVDEDGYHWLRREVRLGEIFKKFKFETPEKYLLEFIWLDNGGSRSFETSVANNTETISKLVMDRLDSAGIERLKRKILENMRTGIKLESVLGNHIALCRKLHISEATDLILDVMRKTDEDSTLKIDATAGYLELGGSMENVAEVFRNIRRYDDYYFYHLTDVLKPTHTDLVISIAKKALAAEDVTKQRKIQLAELLAELGVWEGFEYLVNDLRLNKTVSFHVSRGRTDFPINTAPALETLSDLMYLIIDNRYFESVTYHDSAKHLLLEWLHQFAAKSESDLLKVVQFLEMSKINLIERYPSAVEFNWHINRILENFRNSDKTQRSISEIKVILRSITV